VTAAELIRFEAEVAEAFNAGKIRGPIHLSGGNEKQLIRLFANIPHDAWIFSTWRSHYHALLHGIPRDDVMAQIMAGRSMNLAFPQYRFFTSAIVGGILPIAVGVAAAGYRVWCFIGDMAASTGAFHEARQYADGHRLPIEFVIEDNGMSTNSPTADCWGIPKSLTPPRFIRYQYKRTTEHVGTGQFVHF
jgi:pyruvate dehydrogenase E1 component alpha subunit